MELPACRVTGCLPTVICVLLLLSKGNATVPVANCTTRELSSHSKSEMKFSDYIEYWRSCSSGTRRPGHELLYTKDWHFVRYGSDIYHLIHRSNVEKFYGYIVT